jgi:hippurate hydrolase
VTVGKIVAGTVNNIIPETAEIEGTIRAVSETTRRLVHDGIRRVAEGIASAHDAEVMVEVVDGYPVTVNDKSQANVVLELAGDLAGADKTIRMPNPIMGAEDFSYVLQQIPWAMVFLGGTHTDRNLATAPSNHSNRVVFDEEAMVTGTAMYAAMALNHLGV